VTALKLRAQQQDADRERACSAWTGTGLVFTTRFGTPMEPRNFTRSFERRIGKANVRRITVHGTRKSCGSLLAACQPRSNTRRIRRRGPTRPYARGTGQSPAWTALHCSSPWCSSSPRYRRVRATHPWGFILSPSATFRVAGLASRVKVEHPTV
jgi:hypothetical protein